MSNHNGPNGRIIKINDNWYLLNMSNFARFVSMSEKYRREEGDDNGNIITFKGNDPKEDNEIEIIAYPPPPPAPPAPPASVSGRENRGRLIMVLVPSDLLNGNKVNEVPQFAEFASRVLQDGDPNPDANSPNQDYTSKILELVSAVNKNKSGGKKIGLRRRSSTSRRRRSTKRRTASRKQQKRRRGSRRAH